MNPELPVSAMFISSTSEVVRWLIRQPATATAVPTTRLREPSLNNRVTGVST